MRGHCQHNIQVYHCRSLTLVLYSCVGVWVCGCDNYTLACSPPGTDRSNVVEIPCANCSYPIPWEKDTNLFKDASIVWSSFPRDANTNSRDIAVAFASAGYYNCFEGCTESVVEKGQMNQLLNNAPASFEGAVLMFSKAGNYYYMCSRNNNFTNRSQKGQLTVSA